MNSDRPAKSRPPVIAAHMGERWVGPWRLPGSCRLCHRWSGGVMCAPCVENVSGRPGTPRVERCPRCALPSPSGVDPCRRCQDDPPTFDHAIAAFDYRPPWSSLVGAFKFQADVALAHHLGDLLVPRLRQRWWRENGARRGGAPSVLLPMPLSAERLRERGYNQSWWLARHLAQRLSLPAHPGWVLRTRHTPRLMELDADQREAQIRGAFALTAAGHAGLAGRHVALIDDVLTTGASANEVARVLWRGGAAQVSVWVLARTPAPPSPAGAQGHAEAPDGLG